MEGGDVGTLAARPVVARVDGDVVSRFATCCRALGLTVYERRRPADLAAARSGFAALTRIAHDQCDAWTGLAAAGDVSTSVLESISRTVATAGMLQRQIELTPAPWVFSTTPGCICGFAPPNRTTFT
ncbi:ESX-3 secretion system EccA3 domain protein [Mycobacterium xenopi 4042]|uniref:ESX-3 secretion system EccA3 domain protein n=1 Tax=Mycobacterium xenopi 4042 TaxID=1299334 RepID=X7ZAS6_MYCXE|nr:ESX-3 secretion system EccA3 domain protein [Mycobacterium xenopi 4042]